MSRIRTTGLDVVSRLTLGDLLSVSALAGHRSEATQQRSYNSAAAREGRTEELSQVMQTQERLVVTGGKINPQNSPVEADILAATPGWLCVDPYSSPIPGEIQGTLCQALGRCPACPHCSINKKSSYAFARALQLKEEVVLAQTYLETHRWKLAYEPVLVKLLKVWLPSFADEKIISEAKYLSLNPIGRLE